jgi:membrane protease YdiL (CAAX protease family)
MDPTPSPWTAPAPGSPPPRAVDGPPWTPVLAFFGGSVLVMLLTAFASAAFALVAALIEGVPLQAVADDPDRLMSPAVLGAGALVQMLGLGGMTVAFARLYDDERVGVQRVLALQTLGPAPWLVAGGLGALTVGLLPGWVASQILQIVPELGVALQAIAEHLLRPDPVGKSVLILAICVGAPIAEEIAFRGYLWRHLEPFLPGWGIWLTTSVVFAAYHLDPVQSPSLLPTALFLGGLRWASGSVAPAVFAHAVNNSLAVIAMSLAGEPDDGGVSFVGAASGMGFTLLCCAAAAVATRRPKETG